MKSLAIPLLAILVTISLSNGTEAGATEDATRRFEELKRQTNVITKVSAKADVAAILGEPLSKGVAGWNNPDTQVWTYLDFADDSQYLRVAVQFSGESGCAVTTSRHLRKEIKKGPLRVTGGIVQDVYPNYPSGKQDGFLCHVRFDDGSIQTVAVAGTDRVTGEPAKGSKIRIEHYGTDGHYVYVSYYSLLLEAIKFTQGEPQR